MLLMLKEMIRRSGLSDYEFHRTAYWWCFQKDANLHKDVQEFKEKGKITPYIRRYVMHLEKNQ